MAQWEVCWTRYLRDSSLPLLRVACSLEASYAFLELSSMLLDQGIQVLRLELLPVGSWAHPVLGSGEPWQACLVLPRLVFEMISSSGCGCWAMNNKNRKEQWGFLEVPWNVKI